MMTFLEPDYDYCESLEGRSQNLANPLDVNINKGRKLLNYEGEGHREDGSKSLATS